MGEEEQQKFVGLVIGLLIVFYLVIQAARTLLPWVILFTIFMTFLWIYDRFAGYNSSETVTWIWLGSVGLVFVFWFVGYGITGTGTGEGLYVMGESFHNLSSELTDAQLEAVDAAEESTTEIHNQTNMTTGVEESTERSFSLLRIWIRLEGLIPTFP